MRKVISEHLNIPYNDVILKRTEKGKPYLVRTFILYNYFNYLVTC